jgi:hypothetical protein
VAADRDAPDAARGEVVDRRDASSHEHVQRPVDGGDDVADVLQPRQPRGVKHVGPGVLVGLQPSDRVAEVGTAMEDVLAAGGEHERHRAAVSHLGRRGDASGRAVAVVDRLGVVARRVLDRAPGEPGPQGEADRLGDLGGVVPEAVVEVRRDGASRSRRPARGGQRGEAEGLEELGRAGVPGVG